MIAVETQMYAAADLAADRLGKTAAGTKVEIISILKDFTLIKQDGIYAYVPCGAVRIDVDYRERYGEKTPGFNSEGVLLMEGNLYEDSKEQLMRAYRLIPENIRTAFEKNGFRIKMTEWDVAEEAYSPYGGYHGFGRVKAVMDYERKIIYVNDEWPNAILHEMGHYVNDSLGMYSSRPENREIFQKEAAKISSYAQSNDREYFAEVFRLYVTEPALLEMISPESFILVESGMKKFGKIQYYP